MAAKDHLNTDLFHGTGGAIHGGVVHPSAEGQYGPGAYAISAKSVAESFAEIKAQEQGRLFGTVYRVTPLSQHPFTKETTMFERRVLVADPKGLSVNEAVSHPINPDVDQRKKK